MNLSGEARVNEADIISQIRCGSETAWETFVAEHQQSVFRLAYLMLGDTDEAEDIAQEAFIRAFRAIDSFDSARPARPWLLGIAANLARNRYRSVSRYVAAITRAWRNEPEQAATLGEQSAQQWEAQTLWQAVQRLNRVDQEVIYLRYFLDLSEAEITATLSIARGTVKSRLHRAVSRLRTIVDSEFPALRKERQA
jgi:RNA polymerase sigma-70 factor, ECF subfamily